MCVWLEKNETYQCGIIDCSKFLNYVHYQQEDGNTTIKNCFIKTYKNIISTYDTVVLNITNL